MSAAAASPERHRKRIALIAHDNQKSNLLDWARYKTPITNLYLCGSGTHPGTGLTGGSGANGAREIVKAMKR